MGNRFLSDEGVEAATRATGRLAPSSAPRTRRLPDSAARPRGPGGAPAGAYMMPRVPRAHSPGPLAPEAPWKAAEAPRWRVPGGGRGDGGSTSIDPPPESA